MQGSALTWCNALVMVVAHHLITGATGGQVTPMNVWKGRFESVPERRRCRAQRKLVKKSKVWDSFVS